MKRLRLGIAGAGHLGTIHARLASKLPQFEVVAVADPVVAARQKIEQTMQLPTFASHEAMEGKIDCLVVASPTFLHFPIGLWGLERGIHLFVEKPITASVLEADMLIKAARRNGCVLQVGHVERFNPAYRWVRERSAVPRQIHAVRTSSFTGRSTDIGVVHDLMIHDIDLVLDWVKSPIEEIRASGVSWMGTNEDYAQCQIHFQNGCVASLIASRVHRTAQRAIHVMTDRQIIDVNLATCEVALSEANLEVASRSFHIDRLTGQERAGLKDEFFERWFPTTHWKSDPVNAIECELLDFHRAIESGKAPEVTGEQGREAIDVAERILSAIAGRTSVAHRRVA